MLQYKIFSIRIIAVIQQPYGRGHKWIRLILTSGHYCLLYWPEEKCYSEVLELKLVEPKEASVGTVAKVKQGGKFYSGTVVAVGTRAEIEQQWKELEDGDDLDSATIQDPGTVYVYTLKITTCACISHVYTYMYGLIAAMLHVTNYCTCTHTYWQLKIQKHQEALAL